MLDPFEPSGARKLFGYAALFCGALALSLVIRRRRADLPQSWYEDPAASRRSRAPDLSGRAPAVTAPPSGNGLIIGESSA